MTYNVCGGTLNLALSLYQAQRTERVRMMFALVVEVIPACLLRHLLLLACANEYTVPVEANAYLVACTPTYHLT